MRSDPAQDPPAPRLAAVLETVLYVSSLDRAEAFYSGVLGLRLVDREPERSRFYRLGSGMLLLFLPAATRVGGKLPPHGAEGTIHVCFRAEPGSYDRWKERLAAKGVPILRETSWDPGRSFYFEDPDGNLLEIADSDIWPR